MLRVTNGKMTISITKGAYDTYYKHKGFRIVGSPETEEPNPVDTVHPGYEMPHLDNSSHSEDGEEDSAEGEYEEDLSEIPLGEMDFSQLCDYADQLGVDRDGIRSKKELRLLIKEHLA